MIDLDAIKKRCEAATKGPWIARHRCFLCSNTDDEHAGLGLDIDGLPTPMLRGMLQRGADAQFIAHAREDIPALVAEIMKLQEEA